MAATFIFKLGGLDLSSYCRMNPDDKFDVYGAPWLTPAFTETPYADGQPLISTTVGNREQMIPLFLREASKDLLHQLVRSINVAANVRPLAAEWRDDGASASTFFDVAFLRFEPDFNFRRSIHGYAAGILHIWVAGYGHTGTTRVAGTAAGTGVFLSVPMPSVGGDAPALLDTTITAGALVPTLGRIVAVAPIGHPSYTALIPAASLLSPQAGATLQAGRKSQGDLFLSLPVAPTGGASGIACKVPLRNPTIMGGDNRILAIVQSGISGGVGIIALDPYGNVMGATAVASNTLAWGIVDLGVCRLPTVGFPTLPELSILAGGMAASGQAGPAIVSSPGLSINEIICLPDKNLSLLLESSPGQVPYSLDSFSDQRPLLGSLDDLGHVWTTSTNSSNAPNFLSEEGGQAYLETEKGPYTSDTDRIAAVTSDTMWIAVKAAFPKGGATLSSTEVRVSKDVRASQFVQGRLSASGYLALEVATGSASGNTLASVQIATIAAANYFRLALQVQGGGAFVTLSDDSGLPVFAPASLAQASIGVASNAAIAGAGAPALGIGAAAPASGIVAIRPLVAGSFEVRPIGSPNFAPYDSYRIDGPDADSYRTSSAGVFAGNKLMGVQRGAFPKAAPSTSSVAIVCVPFDQGAANDLLSAAVSVRERYFYAR